MESAFKPQSAEDIENRIEELRKSYTPEWKFDRDNPDAGSVIAQIYAREMEENNRLMSQMPERYHMEFVNMLDSTLRPAQPAASMVIFNMDGGTIAGTQIPKGTRLSAESDKSDSGFVVFETERSLYVTGARIRAAFQTDSERGTLSPIYGDFLIPEIVSGEMDLVEDDLETLPEEPLLSSVSDEEEETFSEIKPFTLFGQKDTIGKSIFTVYEDRLFDGVDEPIYIRFAEASELIERIENGRASFKYLSTDGFKKFDKVKLLEDNNTFMLLKKEQGRKTTIGEKKYSVIILEAQEIMTDALEIGGISISAGGDLKTPEYVGDGTIELDKAKFNPFSDEISVYNECYIGHAPCFSKAGAKVTLEFKVNFHDNLIRLTPEEEEAELSIIKIKPRKTPFDTPVSVKVEEIIIEYYNGIGWKKLECDTEYAGLFESLTDGDYKLSFTCPSDWANTENGPYSGKCLRMRVTKATNCYMRPSIHNYPTIHDLKIGYSYEGKFVSPKRIETIAGTKKSDITSKLTSDKPYTVLSGIEYHEDALYIGLDRKLTDGPVSIYFQLSESSNQNGVKVRFEYMGTNGFTDMRITDLTEDFTRSGTLMFMPPADMTESVFEGNRLYFFRLVRYRSQTGEAGDVFLPRIVKLCLNAVTAVNVQTSDERDYYIEEVLPNASIALGEDHILDAVVWVNEKGYTRKEEMDELLEKHPEMVRAEYDFLGRISAFYVLWHEVDNFAAATDRRSYRIDRMTGRILFSDGSNCDMPRVTDDIAFKARIRSTDGEMGNLSEGEISGFMGASPYISSVYNPIRSHGGSNLETLDHALMRCAGIMNSRYKLVSENDYIRYCLEYSDSIDKARVITGTTIEGYTNPADISIVLLMKDYADGAFSFHRIAAPLHRDILKKCELTISEDRLHIIEPIFVEVSVSVWAMVMDMDDSFEVLNEVKSVLSDFLDPVKSDKSDGWDIGVLPKESQVLMRLGFLRSKAIIQRVTMIGRYIDAEGVHEMDTREIEISPFMVVKSGEHKVYITNK